jgi:hypothetical protein
MSVNTGAVVVVVVSMSKQTCTLYLPFWFNLTSGFRMGGYLGQKYRDGLGSPLVSV